MVHVHISVEINVLQVVYHGVQVVAGTDYRNSIYYMMWCHGMGKRDSKNHNIYCD